MYVALLKKEEQDLWGGEASLYTQREPPLTHSKGEKTIPDDSKQLQMIVNPTLLEPSRGFQMTTHQNTALESLCILYS